MNDTLLFSAEHMWVSIDGDVAYIGISEYAQAKLKSVLFLNLPDVGDKVAIGDKIGDIESVKTVSDLISPVSGMIIEVNESLVDEPDLINEEPYKAWLIKLKVTTISESLMDEGTYKGKFNV